MTNRTISVRADLIEHLEALAQRQGRSLDEVFSDLFKTYAPQAGGNWALVVAEGTEAADIDRIDNANTSPEN